MILLVEDNPADAHIVQEALEEHAVECDLLLIGDGERAIEFVENLDTGDAFCPSLIILDLNLPRKPGREVLERLRASLKCSAVPVVVLTSSDSQKDKDDSARFGVSAYIKKPSRLADFIQLGSVFKEMVAKRSS